MTNTNTNKNDNNNMTISTFFIQADPYHRLLLLL